MNAILLSFALCAANRDGPVEMSLEECVRKVLADNVGLHLGALGNASRAAAVEEALGSFDPELYASVTGADREEPTASSFTAPRNQSLNGGLGLRGLFRSGMTYDLGYQLSYNRQSPTNPFFGFNPTLASDLALNVTQPLLRGFGPTVTEAPVEQARLLLVRGDLELDQLLQETAFRAVEAYWTLVRSRKERDTASNALEVAEELVRNNQRRLAAGVMTRLDVLTAQAEAARRKETLIRAQNAVGRSEDALKLLLSPGANPADWKGEIVPTSEAGVHEETLPDEEAVILAAFASRSDLRALEVDLRAADLALAVAENGSRSQLDLRGSYGFAGLAGKQAGGASKNNVDLWGESLGQIRDREFDQWSLGVDFAHPIGNRAGEAGERRAQIEKERSLMALLERRMQIVQELRGAVRDVTDAEAAYAAARQARLLAEEQYQAELTRLENEHSTTFQVREAQRDLFEARDRETTAITQYEVLRAGLSRAKGDLARQYGVSVEIEADEAGALR